MHNKIDCVILCAFSLSFVFLLLSEKKSEEAGSEGSNSVGEVLLEADDIVVIGIVMVRYAVQIWQMVKAIRNTRSNMIMQRNIKEVDLNNKDLNQSVTYDDEVKQD